MPAGRRSGLRPAFSLVLRRFSGRRGGGVCCGLAAAVFFGFLLTVVWLAFDVGRLAWAVRGPWATGLSGHAVNPSMGARWRHPWRQRSRQAGSPRTRQMAGRGREKREQKRKANEMKVGRGKKSRAPAARLQTSGSCRSWVEANSRNQQVPAHRAAAGPKAAQQAPRFPLPPTHFHSLLLLLLPRLFPTAPRNLSAAWGYRRIGTVGGMDAATEPPWMDSRRVPIRR